MAMLTYIIHWFLAFILIASSLGVILARKPVYAGLSFLLTLLTLSAVYVHLAAEFIAAMQILVYAGAILVIFMFVIILFQDAYQQVAKYRAGSSPVLLYSAAFLLLLGAALYMYRLSNLTATNEGMPEGYGTVQALGRTLYIDFFFPFEAVILLFLIAVIGALYMGKKEA